MSNNENPPDLNDFMQMSWSLPPNNHFRYDTIIEDSEVINKNEELLEDCRTCGLSTKSSDICENTHYIMENQRLGDLKKSSSWDDKDEDVLKKESAVPKVNQAEKPCPYFLRQNRNTCPSLASNDSQLSELSSGNDPLWNNNTKITNKKKKRRKNLMKEQKRKCFSETLCGRYDFRRKNYISSYYDGQMSTEGGAHCRERNRKRNSVRKCNSYIQKSLTEPEALIIHKQNVMTDLEQKPLDMAKTNTVTKRKRMGCKVENLHVSPLKLEISKKIPAKANRGNIKLKWMLLDISLILNEVESTLTDWNYRTRIPTNEEASRLLERLFVINTSLKEEYNSIRCHQNQFDTINSILDYLRKSEDLQSALKRRIKKFNRLKSLNKENVYPTSRLHKKEDLQKTNVFNKERNSYKVYYNKRKYFSGKTNLPIKNASATSSPLNEAQWVIDEAHRNQNDTMADRAAEDNVGQFSDPECMSELKGIQQPAISNPVPKSPFPFNQELTPKTNCEEVKNCSVKKLKECQLFSKSGKTKGENLNYNGHDLKDSIFSNQICASTNKIKNVKPYNKSLPISKVIPSESAQVKSRNSVACRPNLISQEHDDNSVCGNMAELFTRRNRINGNSVNRTLSGESTSIKTNICNKGSSCAGSESKKCVLMTLPVEDSNSLSVSDVLERTPLTKLCPLTPNTISLLPNKNIFLSNPNNKTKANCATSNVDANLKCASNFKLFKRKEIKSLNSAPKDCSPKTDTLTLANAEQAQYSESNIAKNSTYIQKELEQPIAKIVLQNEEQNTILKTNENTKFSEPTEFIVSKIKALECSTDQLSRIESNIDLNYSVDKEPNCKVIESIRTMFSINDNTESCEDIPFLAIYPYESNCSENSSINNSTQLDGNLNNTVSPSVNAEKFLLVNPLVLDFSETEKFHSLTYNEHEPVNEHSVNHNTNNLLLGVSINEILHDPLDNMSIDIDFVAEHCMGNKNQDNHCMTMNSHCENFVHQSQNKNPTAGIDKVRVQQINHDNNQISKITGNNNINNIGIPNKSNLVKNINKLLESSSMMPLKMSHSHRETEPTNEKLLNQPTSYSKPHPSDSSHKISIEDIKYLRIYSNSEFLQVENLKDLFTPNVFVW